MYHHFAGKPDLALVPVQLSAQQLKNSRWDSSPADVVGIAYQVLHLARPGPDELPAGRQW